MPLSTLIALVAMHVVLLCKPFGLRSRISFLLLAVFLAKVLRHYWSAAHMGVEGIETPTLGLKARYSA
jgi:hypothetical protein